MKSCGWSWAAVLGVALLSAAAGCSKPVAEAPSAAPSDSVALRALHEKILEAHRKSDVEILLADNSADYVVANRGAITHPTIEEQRNRLGPYLASTRFSVYRDLVEPEVRISADGTLGWVIVEIEAKGVQTDEAGKESDLAFVSAWIELYRKQDGKWLRTGNVSNFKS